MILREKCIVKRGIKDLFDTITERGKKGWNVATIATEDEIHVVYFEKNSSQPIQETMFIKGGLDRVNDFIVDRLEDNWYEKANASEDGDFVIVFEKNRELVDNVPIEQKLRNFQLNYGDE